MALSDKLSDKMCFGCGQGVVNAIYCSDCGTPYHPSCASRTAILDDGAFVKCHKSRSALLCLASQSSVSDNVPSLTVSDVESMINNSVGNIINSAISGLRSDLQMNFSCLTDTV